ncbi:hypothetical protein K493DRAFT_406171 [Basidiobolus meristosporus CBS 931.73]|uniref:BCAS3 WD40 domain-containing protein n=1 Tax=Basidiobolus meristosporus CBS 931.73 TaxID=1314790 RepID=A0A1Y1YNP4_9FUNG|nr:hypothetical protein K493DRAFT_406171 [Basidiobolus meristosporus CBS 931.73]|eukprot:ORX99647.1 hypothetical protein K493DRAFT_406171 [Basidiobolus meristosporus CBS 931.73]
MTGPSNSAKPQKPSAVKTTPAMGMKAEPKYFRESNSLHSISSVLHGISTYVAYSLPESLSRVKRSSLKSESPFGMHRNSPGEGGVPPPERRKSVTYASFQWISGYFEYEEVEHYQKKLCLLLGYNDGFQIWDLTDRDNIYEIISFRDELETICIKAMPDPRVSDEAKADKFQEHRALIAYVTEKRSSTGDEEQAGTILNFYSLRTHEHVKTIHYDTEEITDVKVNERAVVVLLRYTGIDIYSPLTLEKIARYTDIYCHPFTGMPIVALGDRLIAYGTSTPPPLSTRNSPTNNHSNNFNVERVAKEMMNGVKTIGGYGYKTLSNYLAVSPPSQGVFARYSSSPKSQISSSPSSGSFTTENKLPDKTLPEGMVIVRDLLSVMNQKSANQGQKQDLPIAHFQAHHHAVAALAFSSSGSLLVTASTQGTSFQIFGVTGVSGDGSLGSVKHLYKLARGYTSAHVENIVFSPDSKWLAVSTGRGTTHIYAINPYGGPPNVSSHIRHRVENERGRSNGPVEDSPHVSLSSIVRIKQKNSGVMDLEIPENDGLVDGSPGAHSHSSTESLHQQQIHTSPIAFFIDSNESMSPTTRRGSESMPSGHQNILTFNMNGTLTLHRLDITSIPLRKKKHGVIVNTFELSVSGEDVAEWNLCRGVDWPSITNVVKSEKAKEANQKKWLAQSEISTYHVYETPLWGTNQFALQTFDLESFKTHSFDQLYPKARDIEFRKDMPVPYGVYIPMRSEDHEFSSDNELEGDLSNAIDSSLASLPLVANKSNEIEIPNSGRSKAEELSFDDLNFIEIEDMHTTSSNCHGPPTIQSSVEDLEFLGYLNDESGERNMLDEEILDEEGDKYPADSLLFMRPVELEETIEEREAPMIHPNDKTKKSKNKSKKGKK